MVSSMVTVTGVASMETPMEIRTKGFKMALKMETLTKEMVMVITMVAKTSVIKMELSTEI
jgi:hypothetical protein